MVARWLQVFSLLMVFKLAVKQLYGNFARYISVLMQTLFISLGAAQLVWLQEKIWSPYLSNVGQKLLQTKLLVEITPQNNCQPIINNNTKLLQIS